MPGISPSASQRKETRQKQQSLRKEEVELSMNNKPKNANDPIQYLETHPDGRDAGIPAHLVDHWTLRCKEPVSRGALAQRRCMPIDALAELLVVNRCWVADGEIVALVTEPTHSGTFGNRRLIYRESIVIRLVVWRHDNAAR